MFQRRPANVMDSAYDANNAGHIALVKLKLSEFSQAKDSLMGLDSKLVFGVGCDAALWLTGFLGPFTASILLTAISFSAIKYGDRVNVGKGFSKNLDELMRVYHWMLKNQTATATQNSLLMDVMEAISPYVQTYELTPWDFTRTNPNDLSPRYIALLAQPPHHKQLVMMRATSGIADCFTTSAIAHDRPRNATPTVDLQARFMQHGREACRLFATTHAETVRVLYGYSSDEPTAPQPQQMTP